MGLILILSAGIVIAWLIFRKKVVVWSAAFPGVGTTSSPRVADLNGDGVLDIVLGAGGEEFSNTEYGVLALDGATGDLLWKIPARNQVVGSAMFRDITGDGIEDVFIGGRSAQLMAIDGREGSIIWEFLGDIEGRDVHEDTTLLNFYTPQWVPDQNEDGVEDLLISFGGYVIAAPWEFDRPSGKLMVISGRDGSLLAEAYVPDRKETYMSPVVFDFQGKGDPEILFGTGGESVSGRFYRATLNEVMEGDLSGAIILDSAVGKGFIAPPVLADITGDGIYDIITTSGNGRILAFNGIDNSKLWETRIPHTETYVSLAVGYFTDDGIPDFVGFFNQGRWEQIEDSFESTKALLVMVNGQNGEIAYQETLGGYIVASPVSADFNNDGWFDSLVPINSFTRDSVLQYFTGLYVVDFQNSKVFLFGEYRHPGQNLGTTPLITDLDNDGKMDVVHCRMTDDRRFYSFNGFVVERLETGISLPESLPWGAYMGSGWDGLFKP